MQSEIARKRRERKALDKVSFVPQQKSAAVFSLLRNDAFSLRFNNPSLRFYEPIAIGMSEPTTIESSSFNQPSGSSVFQERMGDLDDYQFCPIKKENVEEEEEYLEVIEPGEESCQDDNYLAVEGTEEIPEMINLTGRGQTKVSGRQFFDDITDLVLKHPNEFRGTRYSFAKVAEELATKYGVEAGPDFRTRVAATWNNHRRYLMVLENKGRELTKREQWILNFKKGCNMEINESEPQVQAHQTTRHSRKKIKKTTALMEAVASCSHLKKSNKPGGNSVFWTLVEQRFLERLPNCSRKGLRPKLQQILSGVTVRARKKVASGRKLKSDEKLALKVNGNCNSPKNSTANGQDDLSHARRSRRSSTTVQNTSVTSLNYSDAFKFIVCNAVAKHPELFEAQRTRNFKLGKEIWKRIEQDIREGHPGPENLSAICQAWQRCKEHAFSHKKSGKMREIDKLVFDILSKNSPESLSRRLDTINRSVGQRDSNVLESLSTEMDTTVASERSENLSGRPRRSCRSSVANYKDPVLELSSEDDEINANSAAPSAAVSRRSVAKNSQRIELASAEAVAPTSSVIREGGGSNAPRNDDTSANNALQTPMPLTEKEPSPIRNLNSSTTSETASFSGSSTTEKVLREEGANRENKSLSLQEWLKVAEFCKRTKHAFRLDGNELVLTDREAPENEFRLPIDRVMSQLA